MQIRVILTFLALAVAAVVTVEPRSQTQAQTPKPEQTPMQRAGQPEQKSETPRPYVPGLEIFMGVIQNQHVKLWYAGQAKNWDLAAYQLGEIKEVLSDVQEMVPVFKNLPLAEMVDAVLTKEIAALEKAVDAKDSKAFAAGFDKLTAACNSCHQGTENGFIVIRRPVAGAFPNQDFSPRKQR